MNNFKGNLRNSTYPIMKVRIRNNDGTPAHKSEFRLDDKSSVLKFLNVLKDKFGVTLFEIKKQYRHSAIDFDDEFKERIKILREGDEELRKKIREKLL